MQLRLQQIQKTFGSKPVLRDCSFTFEQGKIYGLLGRNGAGKTTLFNCVAGELAVDGGRCLLESPQGTHDVEADDVGYVYSMPILPDFLTGYEFVKFFLDIHADRADSTKRIEDYFEMVAFEMDDMHRLIKGYSHGMKNKMQLLCVLIARPHVMLLDEPLTSLDVVVALQIKNMLRQIAPDHIIIFSTHILQLAADLCDEVVVLHDGQLRLLDHEMLGSDQLEQEILTLLEDKNDA